MFKGEGVSMSADSRLVIHFEFSAKILLRLPEKNTIPLVHHSFPFFWGVN